MLFMEKPVELFKLLRSSSLSRLKSHSKIEDIELAEPDADVPVFGHWMGIILLSGPDLRVTFKVHYGSRKVRALAASAIGQAAKELSLNQIADFMREYCNMTAGHLKGFLDRGGLEVGISLPLIIRGFDEIFFSAQDGKRVFGEMWKLHYAEAELTCSASVEVFEPAALYKVPKDVALEEETEEGAVDFL